MPKYWGKQIFAHGRFPEVGPKQKTERERLNDGTRKAAWAKTFNTLQNMSLQHYITLTTKFIVIMPTLHYNIIEQSLLRWKVVIQHGFSYCIDE